MIRLIKEADDGTFRFEEFRDSDGYLPSYAILSHTWSTQSDDDELLYTDVLESTGQDKPGFQKLKFCMQQARKHGLRYCWVDTCCIDKKSSQDVTRAITSMFRWYQKSTRCYALLSDVLDAHCAHGVQSSRRDWESAFRQSRWFSRGWTLQELLAPASVEFFTREGTWIGDKESLVELISEVTEIPARALRGAPLDEFEAKDRLEWVESRQTKEPEDMAYCLLGIFDVTVIPAYGEGKQKAFKRLREEIDKSRLGNLSNLQHALPEQDHALDHPSAKRPRIAKDTSLSVEQIETLLESLKFDQIEARRMTIKKAHTKTCKWLLRCPKYKHWLDPGKQQDHNGFLWIKGKPGSGKSTIMNFALDHTQKSRRDKIFLSFFFNARGVDLEKAVVGAYRTLLAQLMALMPSLRSVFDTLGLLVSGITSGHQWNVEILKRLLGEAIRSLKDRSVICFIDALDECDEDEVRDMIKFLESICEEAAECPDRIRVCLASRYYPHVTVKRGLDLMLDREQGHEQDIADYLDDELRIGRSTTAEQIRSSLLEKASGVFIWVVLVVGLLNKEYDSGRVHALQRRLAEIPSDVHALFCDILTRDSHNRAELALCIQWVLFARSPLTAEQLYLAILSGSEERVPSCDELMSEDIQRFVLDSSKGLTEMTRAKVPTVQFIHESVRDFLLKENGLSKVWPDLESQLDRGHSHERLRQCCQQYADIVSFSYRVPTSKELSEMTVNQSSYVGKDLQNRCAFLRYAVENLLFHADRAEAAGVSQQAFLDDFKLREWVLLANIFQKTKNRRYSPVVSLLYVLADRNMSNLIRIHRSPPSCFELEREEGYGLPLIAALAGGHPDATFALLKRHADRTTEKSKLLEIYNEYRQEKSWQGYFYRNFTLSSPGRVFRDMILFAHTMLLDFIAEAGVYRGDRGTELADFDAALERSHLRLMRQIRAQAAYPQTCNAAFVQAASRGDIRAIDILLDFEVHVNVGQVSTEMEASGLIETMCTALTAAVCSGNVQAMKVLLARGADIDGRDTNGRYSTWQQRGDPTRSPLNATHYTPLIEACSRGRDDMVKILLCYGADIDFVDKNVDQKGRSALCEAVIREHTNVVKLLINQGADTNVAVPGTVWNPWYVAFRARNKEIFDILLTSKTARTANCPRILSEFAGNSLTHNTRYYSEQLYMIEQLLSLDASINAEKGLTAATTRESVHFGVYSTLASSLRLSQEIYPPVWGGLLLPAAEKGYLETVKLLAYHNFGVNDQNYTGYTGLTALHIASFSGSTTAVKTLLACGADINARSELDGGTPVAHAASYGHKETIRLLIENGADVRLRDHAGLNALERYLSGTEKQDKEIERMLGFMSRLLG